jgi:hypothetical protein
MRTGGFTRSRAPGENTAKRTGGRAHYRVGTSGLVVVAQLVALVVYDLEDSGVNHSGMFGHVGVITTITTNSVVLKLSSRPVRSFVA